MDWKKMILTVSTLAKYGGLKELIFNMVFSGTVHWFEVRQAFIHYCGLHQV